MRIVEVVGAVLRDDQGRILCALRSPRMSMPGLWEFPGGKVEPAEEPAEALRREIREELGCEIAVGELVADVTYPYPGVTVRLMTYHARLTTGHPTPSEHDRLEWLRPSELVALNWAPADLPTVERLVARE